MLSACYTIINLSLYLRNAIELVICFKVCDSKVFSGSLGHISHYEVPIIPVLHRKLIEHVEGIQLQASVK